MELLSDGFSAGLAYFTMCFLLAFGNNSDLQIRFYALSACLSRLVESRWFFIFVFLLKTAQLIRHWIISQELLICLSLCARDYTNTIQKRQCLRAWFIHQFGFFHLLLVCIF